MRSLTSGHGSLISDMQRDAEEVRQYLIEHPRATIGDVAMCCNMGYRQASQIVDRLTTRVYLRRKA
jgi:hypothetical protein